MTIWKQKDGTEILVEDMTENHLMNSILLIERRIRWNNQTLTMLTAERTRRERKRAALDELRAARAKAIANAKVKVKPTPKKRVVLDDVFLSEL